MPSLGQPIAGAAHRWGSPSLGQPMLGQPTLRGGWAA
ncbi:hypothetical protein P368_19005 [Comamonas thiooxydans]|nr:hypothetical protein P369_19910 [Comamonas thiooxydans]KGG97673.1 hypothetical protein P365_23730 [Comamonas thiooxydans]KGG98206.1 hypothetical protein P367_14960 [Comamonas thiooxydans]KGH09226.1 hypothetical protein P368_19005 [Comamonas thiooxydans]